MLVLIGGYLWTYILAVFCEVIANSRPDTSEFRRNMDHLNRMMRLNNLPQPLRHRLREYFHRARRPSLRRGLERASRCGAFVCPPKATRGLARVPSLRPQSRAICSSTARRSTCST